MTYRIQPRASWGYRQARSIRSAPRSRRGLTLHYGVTPEWTGAAAPRNLQQIAFGRGFAAISYPLVATQAGEIFSARPLDLQGAHTAGYNRTWHAVCVPGGERSTPTEALIDALAWLFAHGRERGWWGDHLEPHRALTSTSCPGPFEQIIPEVRRRADDPVQTPDPKGDDMPLDDDDVDRIAKATVDEWLSREDGHTGRNLASMLRSGGARVDELRDPHEKDQQRQLDEVHREVVR